MPLSKYLSSVADKAQSAINASPLAGHLPTGHGRPSSTTPEAAGNQGATSNQQAASQGSGRSHTFGALSNQIRAFGQQYTSATPVQRIVTIEKSISLDFESTARDSKSQSKELYTWGQTEPEDLKDVTDRLAYLNFVHGSLAGSLADKLNVARGSLKALRDAETAIAPRRNIRAGIRQQLSKIEHDQQKGNDRKIAELREQLHQAELEDEAQEQEIRSLKRKGVRESEQLKWEALREYGEKLVLLCQAATPIIGALPVVPPTPDHPYTGAQATGAARASLQRALDNYKTGHINLPQDLSASDLHRSDTRSFGESHASELSRINSDVPSTSSATHVAAAPAPVPHEYKPPAQPPAFNPAEAQHSNQSLSPHSSSSSPPVNVAALNQTPATIPTSPIQNQLPNSATTTMPTPESASQANALPAVTPTIAETGVPVPAQDGGPGPKSGSLLTIHSDSPSGTNNTGVPPVGAAATGLPPSFESAEEEKRRLAAAHGQAMPTAHPPSNAMPGAGGPGLAAPAEQPKYESAEDEKKRLEREERERILHGNAGPSTDKKPDQEEAPPGYKEF